MIELPRDLRVTTPTTWNVEAWSEHLGGPVRDVQALRRDLSSGTLPAAFAATARRHADRPALGIGHQTVTHGQLDDRVGRAAEVFTRFNVGRETTVLLVADNTLETVVAYLGILRTGATTLLANPAYTSAEFEHLARDSGAEVAVATGPSLERVAGLTGVQSVVGLAPEDGHAADLVLSAAASQVAVLPVPALSSDAPAVLAYTSGTTGHPKGVPLSHGNLLASTRGVMHAWRWSRSDVLVHSLPLCHQHGLSGVHATLLAGSSAVVLSRLDIGELLTTIRDAEATVLFAVPAIHERLVTEAGDRGADLRTLRLLTSGSAPLPPATAERVQDLVGQLPLERYGSTEAGLDLSNRYDGPREPGAVGTPLPGVEAAVIDDSGEPLAAGEAGELVFRGPQVFAGYIGGDAAGTAFLEGWFRTGDIGIVSPEDGTVRIVGRRKELIISGGMNVYPREVELAMLEHPDVSEVAVVGVPSERWGEEVVAAVVPQTEGPNTENLEHFLRDRLAGYKRPKRLVLVDRLPRNDMGKIVRDAVTAEISAGTET